ncbi:MAG: hypothetical protein KKD05_11665 [Candidatus Omnitrophica bacterium]|nr:hypothetical protein [Candidatus Omnitrophota bacterium]
MESQLKILEGLTVNKILEIHDYTQIFFERGIILNIYNEYYLSDDKKICSIQNLVVKKIKEEEDSIEIFFSNNILVHIDLTEEGSNGLEFLELSIPGTPPTIIVWGK